MNWQKQALYWTIAFLCFLAFLYVFSGILLPFVAGMVVAYILDPTADAFERMGLSRLTATILILFIFVIIFLLALLIVIPVLSNQLADFIEQVPNNIKALQALFLSEWMKAITERLPFDLTDLQSEVGVFVDDGLRWIGSLLSSIISGGQTLLNIISIVVVTPVVAFYLLYDWDRIVAQVDGWLPLDHADTIRRLVAEMADMISCFLRAQGLICLIFAIFYAIGLSVVGLKFGLLIGLGIGLVSFVPFIGAIIGFILSIGIAFAQFLPEQNYLMIGVVAVIFALGQFLEGNILQPRLLGNHVQLHPVWLMFSLFAFGSLFGFVGMLIAVPTAACMGVLVRFAIEQYLKSDLYRGSNSERDQTSCQ